MRSKVAELEIVSNFAGTVFVYDLILEEDTSCGQTFVTSSIYNMFGQQIGGDYHDNGIPKFADLWESIKEACEGHITDVIVRWVLEPGMEEDL